MLWNYKTPQSFRKDQPAFVLSPTYKINDDLTSYFSIQYGEKAGISQITNGVSNLTKAEKALSYELGLKSAWLDRTLILNADLYLTTIKDYQQAVQVYDAYTTTLKNDGTLWAEQPMYFQAFFVFDRVKALAPQHPEWKTKQPFKAVLDKDMPGPIPHTILVAPGGEIVWRHNGVLDHAAAVNAILDRMNRFYSPGAPATKAKK